MSLRGLNLRRKSLERVHIYPCRRLKWVGRTSVRTGALPTYTRARTPAHTGARTAAHPGMRVRVRMRVRVLAYVSFDLPVRPPVVPSVCPYCAHLTYGSVTYGSVSCRVGNGVLSYSCTSASLCGVFGGYCTLIGCDAHHIDAGMAWWDGSRIGRCDRKRLEK
jgi:hypothetical protein